MALELRKQGGSYRQIAAQLRVAEGVSPKYSEGAAYADVMAALKKLNERQGEVANEVRRLELERLDEMFSAFYPKAVLGDEGALQACLNIMRQRASLQGLNAPVVVNQTNTNVSISSDEYAEALARAAKFETRMLSGADEAPST